MPQMNFERLEDKEYNASRITELEAKENAFSEQNQRRIMELEDKQKTYELGKFSDLMFSYAKQAVKPFVRVTQTYEQERKAGRELVAKGISPTPQPLLSRIANIGLGTLQYVFSPIEAIATGAFEEPIEEALIGAKVPPKSAEFIGKLGHEAVFFIPPGGTIRSVMMRNAPSGLKSAIKPSLEAVAPIERGIARREAIKENILAKRKEARQAIEQAELTGMKTEGPLKAQMSPQVRQEIVDSVTKAGTQALEGNFDESRRIFNQIGESLALGEINPTGLPEILKKWGLTPAQFAKEYERTVSFGGRILGYHSRAKQQLMEVFKNEPEALAILESAFQKEAKTPYAIDKAFDLIGKGKDIWRASLVSQIATSMRNAISQTGRLSVSLLDETIQSAIMKGMGEKRFAAPNIATAGLKEINRDFNKLLETLRVMKPKSRDKLLTILDENNAALQKARLFSQPVHEVSLGGKYANFLSIVNRTQEFFFRRIAFEAKLRQMLQREGLNFNTVNPRNIPEDMLAESVNYALEMTFASSGKSRAVQNFIKSWSSSPAVLINPFPRFAFANAIPFVFEHSPLGYLNAVSPSTLKALASGDASKFAKAASRATVGTMMLDAAFQIRQSENAGENWYEYRVGKDPETGETRNIDLRGYMPLTAPLFIAEAFVHPERLRPGDYGKMLVGLNRIAGSGLVFSDWLRARSGESARKQIANFVGQHVGSWVTPSRTLSDFYSGIDEEEGIVRDWKQNPLIAPVLANIPEYSQMLPEQVSPLTTKRLYKGEPIGKFPAGWFRQLTGISIKNKNIIQQEVDAIGLDYNSYTPKTGIPEADRFMKRRMGPMVEAVIPKIITGKPIKIGKEIIQSQYPDMSLYQKREILTRVFQKIKSQARREMDYIRPDLGLKQKINRLSENEGKLIKEIQQ
jgi:hypothetical protein